MGRLSRRSELREPNKPRWELHLIDVLGKEEDLLTIVSYADNFIQLFLQINFMWCTMSFRVFFKIGRAFWLFRLGVTKAPMGLRNRLGPLADVGNVL